MDSDSPIENYFRLTKIQKGALKKLGLSTIKDLLFYFPAHYGDTPQYKLVRDVKKGDHVLIYGRIQNLQKKKAFRKKIPMTTATIEDASGKLAVVWFHQPYIAEMLKEGAFVTLKGKISEGKRGLSLSNPDSLEGDMPEGSGTLLEKGARKEKSSLQGVYPETRGITSRWFYYAIKKILSEIDNELKDPIPSHILKKYNLPTLNTAIFWIHVPQKEGDAIAARKRFAFEEIFFIQLMRQKMRHEYKKNPSYEVVHDEKGVENFVKRFPFTETTAQKKALRTILSDFQKKEPMSRLLEGDVGSGKTAVAAASAYAVATSRPRRQNFGNLQVAYMVPTEILARQQFENFISYFSHLPIQIGLITSSGCQKFPSKVSPHQATDISRAQLLRWVANGEIPIVVGTHSLIQKTVSFKDLAYVIIDEQHRFGIEQRKGLLKKNVHAPHLLSMTATPIPRTLALTIYGDLDLSLLDEMPPGRKPIITKVVLPSERDRVYEDIRETLRSGRQCYIITPRIDEPDPSKIFAIQAKSAKKEAERLKKEVFPEFEIAVMHGKLKDSEKESVMEKFKDGKIQILVSTSIVEVGLNVPNATAIVIEGAERFGLAQLHQLRGRVLRSTHQAYCYIFADTKAKTSLDRLRAIEKAKNGFELAELDLNLRGSGELSGKKQWGLSDLGMEAIRNLKMVEAARDEAQKMLAEDVELKKYPHIKELLREDGAEIHFE